MAESSPPKSATPPVSEPRVQPRHVETNPLKSKIDKLMSSKLANDEVFSTIRKKINSA